MPIYEFECTQCGKKSERYFSEIRERINDCEDCGSLLAIALNTSRLEFRGSGFHVNDYKERGIPDACPE